MIVDGSHWKHGHITRQKAEAPAAACAPLMSLLSSTWLMQTEQWTSWYCSLLSKIKPWRRYAWNVRLHIYWTMCSVRLLLTDDCSSNYPIVTVSVTVLLVYIDANGGTLHQCTRHLKDLLGTKVKCHGCSNDRCKHKYKCFWGTAWKAKSNWINA